MLIFLYLEYVHKIGLPLNYGDYDKELSVIIMVPYTESSVILAYIPELCTALPILFISVLCYTLLTLRYLFFLCITPTNHIRYAFIPSS